jgi:iron complex outermembrane receptor protein
MKKKKISQTNKKLLYALLSSSLLWHTPFVAYAAEEPAANAEPAEQKAAAEETSNQRDFTLEGVEVTASREKTLPPAYAGGQVARGANLGVLGNKDFMDTPFNLTSYTAQTIEDQQARTLYDVLRNDPSVRYTTPDGHIRENFTIRGFGVTAEEVAFNGLYGLAPNSHTAVELVERVEVLKGPSALLNGMSPDGGVGGSINLVPKRAGDEPLTQLTTDYTSSSHWGEHIDIGRRFGENKEFGVRFNGVYRDGKTGVDDASKTQALGSLGLDYRGERWRVSLDAYDTKEKYENGSASSYSFASQVVDAPDPATNLMRGVWGEIKNKAILLKTEYDIKDNLTVYAGIGKLKHSYAGNSTGNHGFALDAQGNVYVQPPFQRGYSDVISSEIGLRSKFRTGSVEHQLVLSANALDLEGGTIFKRTITNSNIYDPVTPVFASDPGSAPKTKETKLSSTALADTLSFDQDKVQLTVGMRRQNVHTKTFNTTTGNVATKYDESAITPVAALVVKPWDAPVSLYANYIEGLSAGTEVTTIGALNYGEVFKPYKSKQSEFGVKWDGGKFANTLSFYQIEKPSLIKVTQGTGFIMSNDGEQRSRGIEWSTFGEIKDHVRLLGGVAYTRGEYTSTAGGVNQGNTPFGVPKYQINMGVEWDTPWNRDLTLSARATYTSSQFINATNTMEIPSWVRYDIGARYKTVIDKTPVTFRASVENLFDKNYWSGSFSDGYVTLGGPRTFKLSATINL